jgi:deoxycytidylate deaminase
MYARKQGICGVHGEVEFVQRGDSGTWRCVPCRAEAVTDRRRRVKAILVEEAGGRCITCGYNHCMAALQFHHVAPETKQFSLGRKGVARSLEKARAEARKCVLLCANCHAEVEAGVLGLP